MQDPFWDQLRQLALTQVLAANVAATIDDQKWLGLIQGGRSLPPKQWQGTGMNYSSQSLRNQRSQY